MNNPFILAPPQGGEQGQGIPSPLSFGEGQGGADYSFPLPPLEIQQKTFYWCPLTSLNVDYENPCV